MDASELKQLLRDLDACAEARAWTRGKSLAEAWQESERADWMLWLCGKMCGKDGWPTRQQIVLAACACAETALSIFEKKYPNDDRPRKAIEAARAWANGTGDIEEVRKARRAAADAADAAYAADPAADATYAAYAAADVAYAADAADAAYDAAYVAAADARVVSLKKMADIVRQNLSIPSEVSVKG